MERNRFSKVRKVLQQYLKLLDLDLNHRIKAWKPVFEQREMYEVIGALLARQTTLAIELIKAPNFWNGHVAPILLRTMVDTHITLAWILEDPLERSRKYILYGLGQAKLNLEHRIAYLKEKGINPDDDPAVRAHEAWINSQQFTFLTEVDIGSWAGKTAREMAEEADCLSLYNFAYNPFSAATHSMWTHVGKYNLKQCDNPLHGGHRIPFIAQIPIDIDYVYRAAKYANKAFTVFDKKISPTVKAPQAFDYLDQAFEKLDKEAKQELAKKQEARKA